MTKEFKPTTVLLRVPLSIAETLQEISQEVRDSGEAITAEQLLIVMKASTLYASLADMTLEVDETAAMAALFHHYNFLRELAKTPIEFDYPDADEEAKPIRVSL